MIGEYENGTKISSNLFVFDLNNKDFCLYALGLPLNQKSFFSFFSQSPITTI